MALGTSSTVGLQVRRRREQRGMSAAELARRADLSKATLSTLEAGQGNPTIETLDAIASALAVPLTDLLTETSDRRPLLVRAPTPDDGDISRTLLTRLGGGHSLEIWQLRMAAGTSFDGVPHAAGTVEHLLVTSGELTAGPSDDLHTLHAGDLLAFPGDAPHSYRCDDHGADLRVVIATPILR